MYRIIFLLLITSASFGQVLQETNGSRADNRNVFKLGFRLPQVCWVTGNPNLLNYSAFMSKGAMVYDTCAGKIKRWSGSAWISIQDSTAGGGSGDYVDTIYRKAGQDSIFYTINGGTERAVKDSVGSGGGGGVTSDSLAVRKSGPNLIHIISHNSGYNSTTVGSSGLANRRDSANLFLGLRAGQNGTTGYQNIGIGRAALKSTTTSNVNIAIGDSAMANGVGTGTGFNTAIGYRSLVANTSGVGNIGLGYNTLAANTTGSFNIAIGGDALAAKTTASTGPDIAIGSNALGAILGGGTGSNIAIGTNALAGNNTNSKSYNIGIGDLSLNKLTSGTYNVGVGSVTLQQLTTGTNNIHVGAGTFNTGPTTGSYNIMIGGSSGGDARLPNNTGTIFIGGANLGAYTLGAETTTIGYRANRNTGAQSTAVGYNALHTAPSASIANDIGSVAVGYNAGSATVGAAVNDRDYGVYIGHSAASNGSGTTYTGQELIAIGYQSAQQQSAGDYNIAIGRVNLASLTGSNQLAIGGNGVGWIRQDVSGSLRRTLINATTSNVTTFTSSAALEVNGIAGGFLPPRLTTGERNAIASPAAGLSVYNSSLATNDVYTTAWYQQPNGLTGSGTLDFPSTGAHSSSDLTITVTGAADGDIVILGVPNVSVTNESNYSAWVSAANTVTVRYNHYGSGTNNPASGTFKVYVIKN
jgi:hypothetical protein